MEYAVLDRVDRLRRLPPPAVVSLASEFATDLPSSLIVSVSGSWNRTISSLVRGIRSDTGLAARLMMGVGFSEAVICGAIGVENAALVNGIRLGTELRRLSIAGFEYSCRCIPAPE